MKTKKNKNLQKGVVLISVILVVVVGMVYLSSSTFLTLYDQKNLQREKKVQGAEFFAQSGLERAMLDLYLDGDSWLDGEINGNPVNLPEGGNPDKYHELYKDQPLADGFYTVEIDYLQTGGGGFYDKCMLLRSTGRASDNTQKILEQMVFLCTVKNLNQDKKYISLQTAVNEAQNNETIAIMQGLLAENVTINPAVQKIYKIQGGYDSSFQYRSVSNYPTIIVGDIKVLGQAEVEFSGVTIKKP